MLKQTLKSYSRSLELKLRSPWINRVFVSLLFLGIIVAIVLPNAPPGLLLVTLGTFALLHAVVVLIDALIDALDGSLLLAVFEFSWSAFLFGFSYLAWEALYRETF